MIASMAQAGQQSCQCLRILYLQQGRQGSWWCSDKGKYWHLLTFTCFQDIVKITETIVKSLRLHLACREFLLGISSAKISQELVEASPLSHLLPSSYTCLASSTLMISPFTSPPPPSLPFTSVNLPLLLFLLWYSPQISETAVWWCHRSLSQCTRGPPYNRKKSSEKCHGIRNYLGSPSCMNFNQIYLVQMNKILNFRMGPARITSHARDIQGRRRSW